MFVFSQQQLALFKQMGVSRVEIQKMYEYLAVIIMMHMHAKRFN